MRRIMAGLAIAASVAFGWAGIAAANPPPPNSNQVEYWCPNGGVKYEPVSTPFVVPAPPEGFSWTLLVLKAGSEESTETVNETFPNPIVGQAYSRTDGKDISHAILCQSATTTTTAGSTTTTPTTLATTTTVCDEENGRECEETTTTSTTVATTTTATTLATTTTGNVGICCLQDTTTTTAASTSTTVPPTTSPPTTAPTTTAPVTTVAAPAPVPAAAPPTELPHTGMNGTLLAIGLGLLAGGSLLASVDLRRSRR